MSDEHIVAPLGRMDTIYTLMLRIRYENQTYATFATPPENTMSAVLRWAYDYIRPRRAPNNDNNRLRLRITYAEMQGETVDVTTVGDEAWRGCLEYLAQKTKLPELHIEADDVFPTKSF
jgi:hypothetical protein